MNRVGAGVPTCLGSDSDGWAGEDTCPYVTAAAESLWSFDLAIHHRGH
jgi:hypothetical protein